MPSRKPRALRPGDTLSMVSPASPLTPEQAAKGIAILESEGYSVKLYPSTYAIDGYLAGSDQARADDLHAAFNDPETQAVFCSRGGYGCSRLMPYLDLDKIAQSDKMLIGFSDVTVLHSALNRRGLPTVHAPMALTLNTDREAWVYESFKSVLKGGNPIPKSAPVGKTLISGSAEGQMVGGCMILLCDLIGTPEQVDMTDRIVLIEDVDEAPHRVDAMLTHLLNSGSLTKAAGIVMGEMTRTDEKPDRMIGAKPWREIVADRILPLGIPTIIDFPCGHAAQMLSLPLGINARIDASKGRLEYIETVCEIRSF
jgi:muramoyltetrapeptide carboxypeptidase